MSTVYMDGVFDLFHKGHLEAIKNCKLYGDRVVIGIISDGDCADYKRHPIIPEQDRVDIISSLKFVDAVIFPAPLILTKEFIADHKIDCVVHGFANESDVEAQKEFFKVPMEMGIFKITDYYKGISTTDIIRKIKLQ